MEAARKKTFWQRTKDKVLIGVVTALIVGLLGYLSAIIVKDFAAWGQVRRQPETNQKLQRDHDSLAAELSRLSSDYRIHDAVQIQTVKSINEKLDLLIVLVKEKK